MSGYSYAAAILAFSMLNTNGCNEYQPKDSARVGRPTSSGGANADTGTRSVIGQAGISGSNSIDGAMFGGGAKGASGTEGLGGVGTSSIAMPTGGGATNAGAAGANNLAGAAGAFTASCGEGKSQTGDVIVDLGSLRQKISGFGASTAWYSTMSSSDADLLWSTTNGAGLSLHRVRIDYRTGRTSELAIAQLAVARGAKVWATPWTPPITAKSNGSEVGGTLADGQAFATFLAGFVTYMAGQGVNIYAVSAQNEPDASVTYESCSYTGETMAAFIGSYLGPTLLNLGVKVMGPETQNWCGFPRYLTPLLNDPNASKYIDIVATHEYGCSVSAYPQIAQAGKEFWQTEIYDQTGPQDPGMGSALRVAKRLHDALTIAEMSAWHYWWVYPSTTDNGALWDKTTGQPSKRLWIMGNFSRFVRPGYRRVQVTGTAPTGILLSAYTNPADSSAVVVAINNDTNSKSLSLFLSGRSPCVAVPWVTSSTDTLAPKAAVSLVNSRLTYDIEPQSVTTFVLTP